ncbi:MerR HTH family regulatory protein [Natronincola peptidivorans]|uniref:MerR HTH family regulatory protein n=1 Tax=Natronincola peptidivorans TaxID=426128 RepID=A0A1H9YKJ5_9FIRM|nr:MerR family transcriptional regulator [Natronincola peptidivorans]SES69557.1 MerR HTH family regulatory protein [Natronincola peptidivorans]
MEIINEIYSIKEISDITGYKPHVIRYYEKEFELEIPRNESNRRYFTINELEKLRYIKSLQEKGLSNKQIKQILKSPEIVISDNTMDNTSQEAAISVLDDLSQERDIEIRRDDIHDILKHLTDVMKKLDYRNDIEELSYKIDEIRNEFVNQEKDVLICENAKLKMKVKEKSYEVAELKEKLKREQNRKISIFTKIFGTSN